MNRGRVGDGVLDVFGMLTISERESTPADAELHGEWPGGDLLRKRR